MFVLGNNNERIIHPSFCGWPPRARYRESRVCNSCGRLANAARGWAVQRYKAPVIYFGLPVYSSLCCAAVLCARRDPGNQPAYLTFYFFFNTFFFMFSLTRYSLKVAERRSNEAGTSGKANESYNQGNPERADRPPFFISCRYFTWCSQIMVKTFLSFFFTFRSEFVDNRQEILEGFYLLFLTIIINYWKYYYYYYYYILSRC